MTKALQWDGRATGRGHVVVYGKHSIRAGWNEFGDTDVFETAIDFEESSMYPFSGAAVGEYEVESVLWDEDTETIVVIVDDEDVEAALSEHGASAHVHDYGWFPHGGVRGDGSLKYAKVCSTCAHVDPASVVKEAARKVVEAWDNLDIRPLDMFEPIAELREVLNG